MRRILFALLLAPCLAHASKSINLNGITGNYSVPSTSAFSGRGSFWVDLRIHGYTIPPGACKNLVQVAGITQVRLCDPAASGGGILAGYANVATPGGIPNLANPPALTVIAVGKTYPAVLSLASAPFAAVMSAGSIITVWGVADPSCSGLNGNHTIQSVNGLALTIDFDARGCAYSSGAKVYGQDILLRLSANLTTNQLSGEAWNVDGTGYTVFTQTISSVNPYTLPQNGLQIGPAPVNLAYLRWCRGPITLNGLPPTSALTAPCGSSPVLADWEFEGNLADSGPNRLSLSFTPSASFIDSPNYAPACNPGNQQSFRAGTSGALDGSRSFPLDGGSTLQMEWQFVPSSEPGLSQQNVHWTSSQTIPFPTFDSFLGGPLNFQLTVTDGSAQSTVCVVHDGAVGTDDNGNISFADPRIAQILGPVTQWGNSNSPWPWMDYIEKFWADRLGSYQGLFIPGGVVTDFSDSWDIPQTGTIDCHHGQTTCTGHGASLQDIFCGGPGNTKPVPSIHLVAWYNYTVPGGGGGTGRRLADIASCPSETSVVLNYAWAGADQTGMTFTSWPDSGLGSWINQSANINYYDNVLAFYSMYYRTGIDSYLHYARWLADTWWTMPLIDRGNGNDCAYSSDLCANSPTFPRMFALTGMYMRAIDQDAIVGLPNSSLMWPGIRQLTDGIFRFPSSLTAKIGDLRENSYADMYVALCAAYDPDPVHAAACRADVATFIDRVWTPSRYPDGSWKAFSGQYTNQGTLWPDAGNIQTGFTVAVQPGSNIVTLSNGTWTQDWFPSGSTFFSFYAFYDGSTQDSRYYQISFVDSTHAQITPAYADDCTAGSNSCSGRSWVISPPGSAVGFGTQPYMLGIAGHWFNQAYLGLSLDPAYAAESALAQSYVVDVAKWVSKSTLDGSGGTDPATRGALYGVGFGICTPGTDSNGCRCGSNNGNCGGVTASRENVGEALGTLAIGYSYAPSPDLQAAIDNVFSANFAKNPTDLGYDGTYSNDLDGWFAVTNNPKWFGFFWGMGRNADYLGARLGGLLPPVTVNAEVSANLASVPGAAKFRVLPTDPSGRPHTAITCSASPCTVPINKVLGTWTLQISYLSAAGRVISTGRPFPYYIK